MGPSPVRSSLHKRCFRILQVVLRSTSSKFRPRIVNFSIHFFAMAAQLKADVDKLKAAFEEKTHKFPVKMVEFIEEAAKRSAARGRTGSDLRRDIFSDLAVQILHREGVIVPGEGDKVQLLYPGALRDYIASRFGKSNSKPNGKYEVTLKHLSDMRWLR